MEIIGDKEFIYRTKKALSLIKKKSFTCYKFINRNLEYIYQNNFSTLYRYDKVIYYVDKKLTENEKVYASYILREAYHSHLIENSIIANKKSKLNCYDGKKNERLCHEFQINILKELGVDENIIKQIENEYVKKEEQSDREIKISGDKEFIDKVKKALLLLKEKDYLNYKTVIQNIKSIKYFAAYPNTFFDRFQERPTCFMNKVEHDGSIENICGALVHEACHNKLYKEGLVEGKNPDQECSGYHAEIYCLTKEIESMKAVGADKELIQRYIECYDTQWWTEPKDIKRKIKRS